MTFCKLRYAGVHQDVREDPELDNKMLNVVEWIQNKTDKVLKLKLKELKLKRSLEKSGGVKSKQKESL